MKLTEVMSMMRRICLRSTVGLSAALSVGLLVGCSGTDTLNMHPTVNLNPFYLVRLNVRGAVMSTVAPYDTLQLTPTAYAADGTPIALPGPVTYTVSDTTLRVSPTGLLTLRGQTGNASYVIVRVQDTVQNVTHADTAFILGKTTVPSSPLAHFSVQPVTGDSAVLDIGGGTKTVAVTATDAAGQPIAKSALVLHFSIVNTTQATIVAQTGKLTPLVPGPVWITVSTTYYGVTMTDSVRYTIGYQDVTQVTNLVSLKLDGSYQWYFQRSSLITGVNKTVIFSIPYNVVGSPTAFTWNPTFEVGSGAFVNAGLSVVFDDSSNAHASPQSASTLATYNVANGSGNITIAIPDTEFSGDSVDDNGIQYYPRLTTYCSSSPYPCAAARSFSTPGTYTYHSATTGATGTITVVGP